MMDIFFTYALHNNQRNKIYIGHTADLEARLARHNRLLPTRTKSYTSKNSGKWKLIYKEQFPTRVEAIRREKQLKSAQGRTFIKGFL